LKMSNVYYEQSEMRRHRNHMERVAAAPLTDRRAGRDDYQAATVGHIAEAGEHITSGNFGAGPYFDARKNILNHPRRNQAAALALIVAAYEFNCPARFAAEAFKKWPKEKQQQANAALLQVIRSAESDMQKESEEA